MDASVTFLLENLSKLVQYHVELISGAEEELESLRGDLDLLKGMLIDASNKRKRDQVFKVRVNQIRDFVYKVEDIIDSWITQSSTGKTSKVGFWTNKISLAKEVKKLREDVDVKILLDKAKTDFPTISIADTKEESLEQTTDEWRKIPLKTHIVGLEEETKTIIGYLKEESNRLEVISIKGMPGLGKTTLAWKIFEDRHIQFEFPVRIWVTVSTELNKKDVLLSILKGFTQQDIDSKTDEDLTIMVRQKLETGKFLIVMDDVWTSEAWDQIKRALPMNNKDGRILITTRNDKVAVHANPARHPFQLEFLNDDKSWELLQYEVYGDLDVVNKDLEHVGQLIAKNCDGLPLSIIVIAGILVEKISTAINGTTALIKKEWERVSESVKEYLTLDNKEGRMSKIIELSYTQLPYALRNCFLYFGMFPEDAEIPVWKLTRLWIAEGFIRKITNYSLEEVALENLKELISRNLVMVENTKADGDVKTCRVHDTIREFCKTEAGPEEENLFQEIKYNERHATFEPAIDDSMKKCRRLCIHSYVRDLFSKKVKTSPRSFLCFPKEDINLGSKDIPNVTNAFTLLRVFDAEKVKFPKFPAKMTQLIHLRYLTLSFTDKMENLPSAMTNLWNLQTLILDTSSRALDINADIFKMMQLRHVKTKASITLKAKDGTDPSNDNLQSLSRLSPKSCTHGIFTKAKNLQMLGVRGDLSLLSDSNSLKKLERLNKLKLEHDVHPNVATENRLRSLPHTQSFPQKLKILTLTGTYLDWDKMSTVENLKTLEVLKLKDHAFMGKNWKVVGGGFTNLAFLYIERTDLTFWTVASDNSFPELKSLILKNCEDLTEVPLKLGKSLEMLYLQRVTKSAVMSAKKIKEEKPKSQTSKRGEGFKLVIAPGDDPES